jgi:hypothetical protein
LSICSLSEKHDRSRIAYNRGSEIIAKALMAFLKGLGFGRAKAFETTDRGFSR